MSLLFVAMGIDILISGEIGLGILFLLLFGFSAITSLIYLFHSKRPLIVLTNDYISIRIPMKAIESKIAATNVKRVDISGTQKSAKLNILTTKDLPADFKKFVKSLNGNHLVTIPLNYVSAHNVSTLKKELQNWQNKLDTQQNSIYASVETQTQPQQQTVTEVSPLVALNTTANSVGASGSFVKKEKFVKKAMQFPVTLEESKLLGKHIAKTYGIVILEILASTILAAFELINIDIGLPIVQFTFSLHGITYIGFLAIFIWLARTARKTHKKSYEISAIALTIWMLTQSILVSFSALDNTLGAFKAVVVVIEAFLITSVIFSSCALYGLKTQKNVANWGGPLLGALLAIIIIMLFNIFVESNLLMNLLMFTDIVVFVLYTIYDNQMIKVRFLANLRGEVPEGYDGTFLALDSSLDIFLDFINLFLDILSLFSSSSNN